MVSFSYHYFYINRRIPAWTFMMIMQMSKTQWVHNKPLIYRFSWFVRFSDNCEPYFNSPHEHVFENKLVSQRLLIAGSLE